MLVALKVQSSLQQDAGLEELWGTSVIHCPFCHGTEYADQAGALLGLKHLDKRVAGFYSITTNLKLLTNGEPITEVPRVIAVWHQCLLIVAKMHS